MNQLKSEKILSAATRIPARGKSVLLLQYLGGFFLLSAILVALTTAGVETRPYVYVFRATFALFSAALIAVSLLHPGLIYRGPILWPLAIFWMLYLGRLLLDGYVSPALLRLSPLEYLSYAVGMCLIPMIAFFRRHDISTLQLGYKALLWSNYAAVALSVWVYRGYLGTDFGRLGTNDEVAVNPLTISYIASSLISLCFFDLIHRAKYFNRRALLMYSGLLLGSIGLIIGASRGSLVAIFAALLALLYMRLRARTFRGVFIFCILATTSATLLVYYSDRLGSNMNERIAYTITELAIGDSGSGRLYYMSQALREFVQHPLFGSGVDIQMTGTYPHNLFIESFMTTGIVGGLAFSIFALCALVKALKLLRSRPDLGWVSILFIVHFIEGQLSGALYMSAIFWYMAAIVITVHSQFGEIPRLGGTFVQGTAGMRRQIGDGVRLRNPPRAPAGLKRELSDPEEGAPSA